MSAGRLVPEVVEGSEIPANGLSEPDSVGSVSEGSELVPEADATEGNPDEVRPGSDST